MVTTEHLQLRAGVFIRTHTLFAILIFLPEPNLIRLNKNWSNNACGTASTLFHLSLPPFPAALVPWWAMAQRSAREAFSQDLRFRPQLLLKCEFGLPEIFLFLPFCRCRSCQAQLTEKLLPRVQSPGGVDFSALCSPLRGAWRRCKRNQELYKQL